MIIIDWNIMTLLGKHWWKRPVPIEDVFASRFFLSLNIIVSIFFAITFTFPTGYHERLVPFIIPENGEKYSLFMILHNGGNDSYIRQSQL